LKEFYFSKVNEYSVSSGLSAISVGTGTGTDRHKIARDEFY